MKTGLKITIAAVLGAIAGGLAGPAWMMWDVVLGAASLLCILVAAQVLRSVRPAPPTIELDYEMSEYVPAQRVNGSEGA